MSSVIEANQLTVNYGKKIALDHISISVNENQLIGLIGRNGSGKTTFMKLCAGLIQPVDGEIKVFMENPMNSIEVQKEIVYSYPNIPHKDTNTLSNILDYFKLFYPRFDDNFAIKLLEIFSLIPSMKYNSLSKGMESLFNYICALSTRAKLTLFDEPVLAMDVTVRKKVYEILLRDYMEHPRTIIISSHILSELEDILSEILLLHEGNIVLYNDIEEVGRMAYRVDGMKEAVISFAKERNVIYEEYKAMSSYAIIESICDESDRKDSKNLNLTISRVRPEDLYIYKTIRRGENDIECLWEKQN